MRVLFNHRVYHVVFSTNEYYAVKKLSLSDQTENEHGIYGNIKSDRAAVKCVAISNSNNKLLVAAAGSDKDPVEFVRNTTVKAMK